MELVAQARFLPAGECALVVEFGATIDPVLNDRVLALDAALSARRLDGIVETVPTYRSLMIYFEPRLWSHEALVGVLQSLESAPPAARLAPRHWVVPACYEPPCAEDLGDVAQALSLSPQRVAALHAGAGYRVYMYGFAPGYVFLGGLPAELAISRRASPRQPNSVRRFAHRRWPGLDRQCLDADRLVRHRPHAGQDLRLEARSALSATGRRSRPL